MKIRVFIVIMLLGGALLGSVACCGPVIAKPTVGYVPQGWYLSDEYPYGAFEGLDGTKVGVIQYTDTEDLDFVVIFYGDVPSSLKGREGDSEALIAAAIELSVSEPEETATMTVSGRLAGYTKAYNSDWDAFEMVIVFVEGSICICIYTVYDPTDEAEVVSLINSISF